MAGRLFEVGANSRLGAFSSKYGILIPLKRGSVCKSGPVHSGSKNILPSNFAQ